MSSPLLSGENRNIRLKSGQIFSKQEIFLFMEIKRASIVISLQIVFLFASCRASMQTNRSFSVDLKSEAASALSSGRTTDVVFLNYLLAPKPRIHKSQLNV